MKYQIKLDVMLKADVADVQGAAIEQSLQSHGEKVNSVKVGKRIEFELGADNDQQASEKAERLAKDVFSNPVIETVKIDCQKIAE